MTPLWGSGSKVEPYLKYAPILAILLGLVYFVVNQAQRRRDKGEVELERGYVLPNYSANDLTNILEHLQSTFPSKSSGLMLCEFSDGKFDVAVGLEGLPVFIGSDYGEIVKVIDLDHNLERTFTKIITRSGYFGLIVFDKKNHPLIGRYKVANVSHSKDKMIGAFQIQKDGVFGKVFIEINEHPFREMPTFEIKEKISIGAYTTPVFVSENEFLGFASYLVPAKYKSTIENGKTIRKLVQPAYRFGVVAEEILKNNKLNFAFDKAEERALNYAKNK